MNDEYENMELAEVRNKMQNVERLKYVANITAGYYPMHSRAFTLKDCPVRGGQIIEGYSEVLKQYVTIERDAVRPIISPSVVQDFVDADHQHYSTCLITADHRAPDFAERYPLAASYLHQCVKADSGGIIGRDTLIRPNLRDAIDKKKVIISTLGNICHAMLDKESHVVTTLSTYLCTSIYADFQVMKAYMSIFNSQLFSYLLYHELKDANKPNYSRLGAVADMYVPCKTEDFTILEDIAECLLYLSRPDIPQLSYRISNDRLGYYMTKIMDMVVYELYFPDYVKERELDVIRYMLQAPFMVTMMKEEDRILETYAWFQRPDNIIRQKIELLDTRSPELLYKIQTFVPNEQD